MTSRWILIATVLCVMAGLFPASANADAPASTQPIAGGVDCVHARWYKVASHTNDDWNGFSTNPPIANPLHPEPGMPQAIGFDSWQAVYADILSPNGRITDIGLWYESTPNNNPTTTYFDDHPAALVPIGQPSAASQNEWMYFTWDMLKQRVVHNKAYVRFQPAHDYPVMLLDYGIDSPWDITFALWIKI
ncbi:MAG: hypothetical protein OXC13_20270 [Caldilineaceae bacterium]|nr:hypothetical protein [Caldilineaceae bacterium]